MKNVIRGIGALVVCLATAVAGIAPASAHRQVDYVALGDSFAAGTGAVDSLADYLNDGTPCLRSVHAYPMGVAKALGWNLQLAACQGATTSSVGPQLTALSPATDKVTITLGGNDIDFTRVILACAQKEDALQPIGPNCLHALDAASAVMDFQLPTALRAVYAQIRAAAPNAEVIAVGYPRLFSGVDCSPNTWYTEAEQVAMNAAADELNRTVARAARKAGFRFVNPTKSFRDHAWCDPVEYINGPLFAETTNPLIQAGGLHPNVEGQTVAYLTAVLRALKAHRR